MTDLTILLSIVGSSIAILGIVVALILWMRSEANADRRDIINLIVAIKDEMKDFHGRLERQDAHFHAQLLQQAERKAK